MSEEIVGIPLPGGKDVMPDFLKGDKWFEADVQPYQLDFEKAYEAPQYTLALHLLYIQFLHFHNHTHSKNDINYLN